MIQSILTSYFVDVSFLSRLNALSKKHVVYILLQISRSLVSLVVYHERIQSKSDHNITSSYLVALSSMLQRQCYQIHKLRTKEMYDNQLGKLIFWVRDWSGRLNIAIYYFKGQLETAEYSPQCKIEVLFPNILNSNLTE